jgi:Protein phosphatase 2C
MNTNTMKLATAAVTGARHSRAGRNGQDAAASWCSGDAAVVAVCDGCSGGASSEVGARLGARLAVRAVAARLRAGGRVADEALWTGVRGELVAAIAELVDDDPRLLEDCFLFTLVVGAIDRDHAAVWAIGDGAYALGDTTRVLGPFADNRPPYLGYDLIGDRAAATFDVARASSIAALAVATDGVLDLGEATPELARFTAPRFVDHPDALRRELVLLARADEQIDWHSHRVTRTPARLQDDCAIGAIRTRRA